MLSPNELSLLNEIISDEKKTFEKISKKFDSHFNNESKVKATMTLLILLNDNILNIHQRIISYYILYENSKKERMETNPFLSLILEKLESSTDKAEQNFLVDFLCGQINYSNITVDKYINQNPKEQRINITQIKMRWDKYYKEILRQKNINIKADDNRRSVIYDRKNNEKNIDNHPNLELLQNMCNSDDNNFNLNYFETNYMSYYPVNNFSNSFFNKEPIWILPSLKHNFLWEKK